MNNSQVCGLCTFGCKTVVYIVLESEVLGFFFGSGIRLKLGLGKFWEIMGFLGKKGKFG